MLHPVEGVASADRVTRAATCTPLFGYRHTCTPGGYRRRSVRTSVFDSTARVLCVFSSQPAYPEVGRPHCRPSRTALTIGPERIPLGASPPRHSSPLCTMMSQITAALRKRPLTLRPHLLRGYAGTSPRTGSAPVVFARRNHWSPARPRFTSWFTIGQPRWSVTRNLTPRWSVTWNLTPRWLVHPRTWQPHGPFARESDTPLVSHIEPDTRRPDRVGGERTYALGVEWACNNPRPSTPITRHS